jgi:hypothetical protein
MSYEYKEDSSENAGKMVFGLNQGVFMKTFKYIENAGQNGTAGEALEIVFDINGKEKSYRQFPVTKAYDSAGNEVSDSKSPEMQKAFTDFNKRVVHILKCFVDEEVIKEVLHTPIKSFESFCNICKALLPKKFEKVKLDIFLQYQWNSSKEDGMRFLEIPKKLDQGAFLCRSVEGNWEEVRNTKGLSYINGEKAHPFARSAWFMTNPFGIAPQKTTSQASASDSTSTEEQAPKTGW